MPKCEDLTNKEYGRLKVLYRVENHNDGHSQWLCKCNCGNEKIVKSLYLKNGGTKSCGCLKEEILIKTGFKNYNNENFKKSNEDDRFKGTKISQLTKKKSSNNTSGHKGISLHKKTQKWVARIAVQGKEIFLGQYCKKEDAIKARKEAEEKYFKPIIEEFNEVKNNESNRSID